MNEDIKKSNGDFEKKKSWFNMNLSKDEKPAEPEPVEEETAAPEEAPETNTKPPEEPLKADTDKRVEILYSEDQVKWFDVREKHHKVMKRRTVNNKTGEASPWSEPIAIE